MKIKSIIEGDSKKVLKKLPSKIIDLVITSPPYNAAHNYDIYDDNKNQNHYMEYLKDIFLEIYRVLKDDGRMCINVPFAIKNKKTKKVVFLATKIAALLNELGMEDFEFITWHKGKNLNHFQGNNTAWGSWKSPSCPVFRPMGESILVFYKNSRRHIGDKEKIDITADEFKNWTKNSWYISEKDVFKDILCIPNTTKKVDHPAPFPMELVERLLKLYSYKDDLVLDPFNGIGSTTEVCARNNRNFIGIDISKKYCKIAQKRTSLHNSLYYKYDSEMAYYVNSSSVKGTLNEIFTYKESFNPDILEVLLDRYNINNYEKVLEPFMGSGSTFANKEIKHCIGYDTNELAVEVSKAKLIKLNNDETTEIMELNNDFNMNDVKNYELPNWKPYSKYANKNKYDVIMSYIAYFEKLSINAFRYVKYTVISNLDKLFDYKRDGNGIKYRESKIKEDEVISFIKNLVIKSIRLKKDFDNNNKKTLEFYNESFVNSDKHSEVDVIVTSPPYVNMFDYFEVYKMELWTSKLIESMKEWKTRKKSALRNNKNSNINSSEKIDNLILNDSICKLKQETIDNKKISMIQNYFFDMKIVLDKLYQSLKKGSYLFIVVGNSCYNGLPIITDEILASESQKIGFDLEEIVITRKLSTSPQQMKKLSSIDKIFLRESIIVLKK